MPEIVVIVDDERATETLREQLGPHGCSLTEARDGESGLKRLQENPPDLVILDIRLPGRSGVEVLEQIRTAYVTLPVIVLTSLVDVDLAVEVMKKGAFDFLTKPVKTSALQASVEKAMAYRGLLEENRRLARESEACHENLERMVEQRTRELLETQSRVVALTARVTRLDQLSAAGRMAATMAHEVSNPMAAIQGYTELTLLREDLDPDLIESLTIIHRQCTRVGQILRQYRNLARLPAPCRSDANLTVTLDEIVRLCASYCLSHKIRIHSALQTEVRAWVDPPQIQQVLFNLVFNACEAMPDGGEIEVALGEGPDEGWVNLHVRDTGVGVREEHLPRIFEDFFSTREDSCGLGLAIVRDIIERHDGRIEVESAAGKGSLFRVLLRQKAPQAPAEAHRADATASRGAQG